jgi:hypothetical protein
MQNELSVIDGFGGYYLVSMDGDVFSRYDLLGTEMRKMKPYISTTGYPSVTLSHNDIKKNMSIHRLVAMAFVPNPDNKPLVNHLDGDKMNAKASNLQWVTGSENQRHSFMLGGRKQKVTQ